MADQLATPEDLASMLQQNNLDRATCELLIEAATAVVQAVVGQRILLVEDDPFELVGQVGTLLQLPERPVVAITSVSLDGGALSAGTSAWMYRRTAGGLYRANGWLATGYGPCLVTGTYTHGLAADDQRIQLARSAVLSLARGSFVNPDGVFSEKIDDYSVAYERSATVLETSPFLMAALRRQYGPKAGFVRI